MLPGVRIVGTVSVNGVPQGKDMIRVEQGHAFTVPAEQVLVVTGVGLVSGSASDVKVNIGGAPAVRFTTNGDYGVFGIPPGLSVVAGQVVEPFSNNLSVGMLLGYLTDA